MKLKYEWIPIVLLLISVSGFSQEVNLTEYDTIFVATQIQTPENGHTLGNPMPNPPTLRGSLFWERLTYATIGAGWKSFAKNPLNGLNPSLLNGTFYEVVFGPSYPGLNYLFAGSYNGVFNAYSYNPANPYEISLAGALKDNQRIYRGTMLNISNRNILVVLQAEGTVDVRYDVTVDLGTESWKKWSIAHTFSNTQEYVGGDLLDCAGQGVVWVGRKNELIALKIDQNPTTIGFAVHQILATFTLEGDVSQIRRYQNTLYVLLYNSKLAIFDVTNPTPVFLKYIEIAGLTDTGALNVHYTSSYGHLLEIGGEAISGLNGMKILSLKSPENPLLRIFNNGELSCQKILSIVSSNNSIFLAVNNEVRSFLLQQDTVTTPVELATFEASIKAGIVNLHWTTATESNNFGFEIQRTTGGAWEKIGFVAGNGTTSRPQHYEFQDAQLTRTNCNYRLKQIDTDGSFEYSHTVTIDATDLPRSPEVVQIFPNPFSSTTTINFTLEKPSFVQVEIFDITGRRVRTLVREEKQPDRYALSFYSGNLVSGLYFVRMQTDRIRVIRKMIITR